MTCAGKPTEIKSSEQKSVQESLIIEDSIIVDEDYLLGKFEPSTHADFQLIPKQYTSKENAYLRIDALASFIKMHEAAKKDGITLTIISATRNFKAQKGIWEAKWNGEKLVEGKNLAVDVKDSVERAKYILLYSSMPGTSRHHWGTDIDINALTDDYFLSGQGKNEYDWLVKNASTYGFCQPYSKKGTDRTTGYEEEKWHWSYYPVSSQLLRQYSEKITFEKIKGFKGSGTAKSLDVIKNWVQGISPVCK